MKDIKSITTWSLLLVLIASMAAFGADTKISDLTELTTLASDDIFVVVDTSETETKKITRDNMTENLKAATATAKGVVELATNAETATGTDAERAVTPAGAASVYQPRLVNEAGLYAALSDVSDFAQPNEVPLDSDFGSNGLMKRTGAGTYGVATEGADYWKPGGADVAIADGGTGASNAATAFANLKQAATDSATGVVELATGAETAAGADTERAVTPDSLAELYQYDVVWVPAGEFIPRATSGAAAAATTEYATNDINMRYCAFDGATEEYVDFDFVMPENWDRSSIKMKAYWAPATGCSEADTVEWEIAAGALSDDDAIDTALGTSQVISDAVTAGVEGDLHVSGATPAITVGGAPALGDLVHLSVSRNVGGTDDMTEDAWLFGVLIQYKRNQVVTAW